jgi:serine/threonine protein kinase
MTLERFILEATYNQFKTEKQLKKGLHRMSHQICEGVKALHALNIIHRNLKPSNIFTDYFGDNVKVGDFSASKILEPESEPEVKPEVIPKPTLEEIIKQGKKRDEDTPEVVNSGNGWKKEEDTISCFGESMDWMSPEILESMENNGKPIASKASDIFSLGLILFFIQTKGKHPFLWESNEASHNIRRGNSNLTPLKKGSPWLPLIQYMIGHDPKERPTIERIVDDVENMFGNY